MTSRDTGHGTRKTKQGFAQRTRHVAPGRDRTRVPYPLSRVPARWLLAVATVVAVAACTPSERPRGELRFWTEKYALRVSSQPSPPRARSRTLYRVEIRDKDSGQPMERSEGQIYASNGQGANIYDAITPGPELGTYYATLNFITAGEWALNMRFRGVPSDTIEVVSPDSWRQMVGAAPQ